MEMNASELKSKAKALGADLVGVASRQAWEQLPREQNPLSIMPSCQSVIVLGRKILRGAFRGVEEGTNFSSTYGHYGANWHEFTFFPRLSFNLALILEEEGYEAVPMSGGTPAGEPGQGVADKQGNVRLDIHFLAEAAGLGSMGKGGFFLSPEYGHRQRLALILTDMPLQGEQPLKLDFCQDCRACIEACPLGAYSENPDGSYSLDQGLCAVCKNGSQPGSPLSCEPCDRLAASCGRACLVALEDKIGEKFQHAFRKRAVWQRDIDGRASVVTLQQKAARVASAPGADGRQPGCCS
jgi:epoxyqueuosine reductase QueG